ncbi:MAG TPA: FtsX-like permease family protein, partial [Ohtaekwangia sp.]|nr:FtsX-like permease family protein [Ohtaekwangia sp.]
SGVAKDFHFQSLHENIKPLFFFLNPERTNTIMVKLEGENMKRSLETLQAFYARFTEGSLLEINFLDEEFQAQYLAETRVATLSRYFAVLAIVISCLGLFGVVMFVTARKTKEISIRKICGAGQWRIVTFLTAEFTGTIIAAIVVALPLSYFAVRQWLNGFAYRIDLEWIFFVGSGLIALFVAWLTISVQAIQAARANPVKNLRLE